NLTAYWLPRQGGLRVGELLSLKKSNLDLPNMRGLVRTEKKRGGVVERQFFWEEETQTVLSEWIAIRDSWGFDTDDLFITRTGKKWQETGLYVTFQRASKKAGVRMVNPHSLRHFFGRDKALKGAEDSTIASLLGHKDIRSSYIYTQLFGTRLETA